MKQNNKITCHYPKNKKKEKTTKHPKKQKTNRNKKLSVKTILFPHLKSAPSWFLPAISF